MEPSSHVIANLDQWVENGTINPGQREIIFQLIAGAVQDAYEYGLNDADDSYDYGWDDGYQVGVAEVEGQRDEWFEQGWAEAILEHGIEE